MKEKVSQSLDRYVNNKPLRIAITFFYLITWLNLQFRFDSLLSQAVLCAMVSAVAFCESIKNGYRMPAPGKLSVILFALAFSGANVLANFGTLSSYGVKKGIVSAVLVFATGYLLARNILVWVVNRRAVAERDFLPRREEVKPSAVFFGAFFCISVVDFLFLVLYRWPGILTSDSLYQLGQIMHIYAYTNHHPFFHTMIIKACMDLGLAFFGDLNSGVAIYSIFQILSMAGAFAFAIMTLHQAGVSKGWVTAALLVFALMPYHIIYSFTMWKDVLFGGVCLLFICALYRIIKNIGSARTNIITLIIGALGTCLLRSNGYLALFLTFIVLAIVLGKEHKKVLLAVFSVLVVTFLMKHGLLSYLGVAQPDTAEFLSIPEQQIARLIVEEVDLTEDEISQISKVMDIDRIKRDYLSYISDPVKNIVRGTGLNYLNTHKMDCLKLWLRLGSRYPGVFIRAWVDQTKGYWNGGYDYWVVARGIEENTYGIYNTFYNETIAKGIDFAIQKFFNNSIFDLFRSIGLHVWITVFAMTVMIIEKRKEAVICVLLLALILTLLISTPVFSEFRYAYALFTSLPFVLMIAFAVPKSAESRLSVMSIVGA